MTFHTEFAEGFNFVAEELHPDRAGALGWIEIKDAAASGELAALENLRIFFVVSFFEPCDEVFRRDLLSHDQGEFFFVEDITSWSQSLPGGSREEDWFSR